MRHRCANRAAVSVPGPGAGGAGVAAKDRETTMAKLQIELCPETGICSLVREDGTKTDLMPDEVKQIAAAATDPGAITAVIAAVDTDFAGKLSAAEIGQISAKLGKRCCACKCS